jgi:hypothetical protein
MGFWGRVFGKKETSNSPTPAVDRPTWAVDGSQAKLYLGQETLNVVGESHYQDNLWRVVGGERADRRVHEGCVAVLIAENDNPHDPNAISVWINGAVVGYLASQDAAEYRPGLLLLSAKGPVALRGSIVGGGFGGTPQLGVFLDHNPADFGLATSGASGPQLRTGLSEAIATDELDDSYQLSWMDALPSDRREAINKLRELLRSEPDPLDRHYMFAELESSLYWLRDVEETALSQYDDACRAHDSEMDAIRPALREKFGAIPLLETYKQQAIRQQKAKNPTEGLKWARRGLELYGTEAFNQDWVDDLRKRVSHFEVKIEAAASPSGAPKTPRRQRPRTVEFLTCGRCGRTWERVRTPGRKPVLCPSCQSSV